MRCDNPPSSNAAFYAVCAASLLVLSLDMAGLALNGFGLLVVLGMVAATLVNLVKLPSAIRSGGLAGVFPIVLCLIVPPAGLLLGRGLMNLRFLLNKDHYEAVATALAAGRYSLPLKPADSSLAFHASAIQLGSAVIAVDFLTVTHGFAGHDGYLRTFDDAVDLELAQHHGLGMWRACSPLGSRWYRCRD
jgi:hypothetical protein